MSNLDQIIQHGTIGGADYSRRGKPNGKIKCADGFTLSVQAGSGMYCEPRPGGFASDSPSTDYEGPYTHAEVGFPSERPEPWEGDEGWSAYQDGSGDPTEDVYGYVPFSMILALITLHGGEVA